MGRYNKRQETVGSLEYLSKSLALQSKGIMDLIRSASNEFRRGLGENNLVSNRQQNSGFLHKETGRDEVTKTPEYCLKNPKFSTATQNHHHSEIPARQIQRNSRQPIATETPSRMAPRPIDTEGNFSKDGHTRNRPLCKQILCNSPEVCERRPQGHYERIHGCFQQVMELQSGLDLPTTSANPTSAATSERVPRTLSPGDTEVGESFLEGRSEEEGNMPSIQNPKSKESPSGFANQPTASEHSEPVFGGMEGTGWSNEITNWSESERTLLQSAWRQSTFKTYRPAWRAWLEWTLVNKVSPKMPSPGDLARYLIHLHNVKKLAPKTILVHKSAIATFTKPCSTSPISEHPLVKKTIKAILLKNPPKRCPNTWNVADLVNWIAQRKIDDSSLFQISQHVAALLLLATGRRVHDLTLLHIDSEHCQITREQIVFWPSFGSKTDNANYRQSGWCLSKSDNIIFDLCHWIPRLIDKSDQRRKADPTLTNLFITTRNRVKAASRSVIAGWLRLILKDAKIKGSPGSFRSAVATDNWVNKNLDIDEVLRKGNWRSSSTFLKHYFKEVESSTRNIMANQTMSDIFSTI
ncbi:uncharacterized protein [Maniola hyperantus]|uniref:uncharacterized protein isoform X1 n=1 Tax=Aphantopus hyperantus TaxID=2795564 RepID=UPI0021346097